MTLNEVGLNTFTMLEPGLMWLTIHATFLKDILHSDRPHAVFSMYAEILKSSKSNQANTDYMLG